MLKRSADVSAAARKKTDKADAPAGRVSEAIVHRIKKQISDGRLAAGQRLPAERDMAKQFSTSRVSVREAYRSLEELGLLQIRRGAEGGAFVMKVNHEPVMRSLSLVLGLNRTSHAELSEARMLIEPPIARLAAQRAQPADIAELEGELIREEEDAHRRGGPFRPTRSNFHRLVAKCAGNFPLTVLMNALADLTADAASVLDPEVRARHQRKNRQSHRALFDAIRIHDEDAAYSVMIEHVHDIQRRVERTSKSHRPPAVSLPLPRSIRRNGRRPSATREA
jgi:GntR family transcriptional regulator, transcriptional repressor for pyruvate dehydrogenase complex